MPPAKKTSAAGKSSTAKTASPTKKTTATKKTPVKKTPVKKATVKKTTSAGAARKAPAAAAAKVAAAVAPQPAPERPASAATTSSRRTPADLAREVFAGVAARDPDAVVAHTADDCVDDFVAVGQFRGKRAIRQFFVELFAATPDLAMKVDYVVGDDSHAVVQWHATGTFTGTPFQGIEATGRRVAIKGVDVMEFRDGKIAHNTIYYDGATFARQVGLLPPQGSRADRAMLAAFNAKTKVLRRGRR